MRPHSLVILLVAILLSAGTALFGQSANPTLLAAVYSPVVAQP
jgi:hypothetical protein